MKKTLYIVAIVNLLSLTLLVSCGTTTAQDREILQKQFKTVYPLSLNGNGGNTIRYICIDSLGNTYDVTVNYDGSIDSKVKVNEN